MVYRRFINQSFGETKKELANTNIQESFFIRVNEVIGQKMQELFPGDFDLNDKQNNTDKKLEALKKRHQKNTAKYKTSRDKFTKLRKLRSIIANHMASSSELNQSCYSPHFDGNLGIQNQVVNQKTPKKNPYTDALAPNEDSMSKLKKSPSQRSSLSRKSLKKQFTEKGSFEQKSEMTNAYWVAQSPIGTTMNAQFRDFQTSHEAETRKIYHSLEKDHVKSGVSAFPRIEYGNDGQKSSQVLPSQSKLLSGLKKELFSVSYMSENQYQDEDEEVRQKRESQLESSNGRSISLGICLHGVDLDWTHRRTQIRELNFTESDIDKLVSGQFIRFDFTSTSNPKNLRATNAQVKLFKEPSSAQSWRKLKYSNFYDIRLRHNQNSEFKWTERPFQKQIGRWHFYPAHHFRAYQAIAVKQSLQQNSLILLPTGTGKTLIAYNILLNFYAALSKWYKPRHLTDLHRVHQDTKVFGLNYILVVPNTILMEQAHESFINHGHIDEEDIVIFNSNISVQLRSMYYQRNKIIIVSPEVLRNDIHNKSIMLCLTPLIIFDEIHKGASCFSFYTQICECILVANPFVRIVGLTGTIASNNEMINNVVNNFDIKNIFALNKSSPILAKYVYPVNIITLLVPERYDFIAIRLGTILQSFSETLYKYTQIDDFRKNDWKKLFSKNIINKLNYQSFLVHLASVDVTTVTRREAFELQTCLELFKILWFLSKNEIAKFRDQIWKFWSKRRACHLHKNLKQAIDVGISTEEDKFEEYQRYHNSAKIRVLSMTESKELNAIVPLLLPPPESIPILMDDDNQKNHDPKSQKKVEDYINCTSLEVLWEIVKKYLVKDEASRQLQHRRSQTILQDDVENEEEIDHKMVVFVDLKHKMLSIKTYIEKMLKINYQDNHGVNVEYLCGKKEIQVIDSQAQFMLLNPEKERDRNVVRDIPYDVAEEAYQELRNKHNTASLKIGNQREIIRQFDFGKTNLLISTVIGQVGIDFVGATVVVGFDSTASNTVNRLQREGRIGRSRQGIAIHIQNSNQITKPPDVDYLTDYQRYQNSKSRDNNLEEFYEVESRFRDVIRLNRSELPDNWLFDDKHSQKGLDGFSNDRIREIEEMKKNNETNTPKYFEKCKELKDHWTGKRKELLREPDQVTNSRQNSNQVTFARDTFNLSRIKSLESKTDLLGNVCLEMNVLTRDKSREFSLLKNQKTKVKQPSSRLEEESDSFSKNGAMELEGISLGNRQQNSIDDRNLDDDSDDSEGELYHSKQNLIKEHSTCEKMTQEFKDLLRSLRTRENQMRN